MMDVTEVIPVYDTITHALGITGVLCSITGACLLIATLSHLLSREFRRALVVFAVTAACVLVTFGAGALMHEPTIRYKAVIWDMAAVEKQYYIVSEEDDGTYIVEPKETK